jgi:hypothetical protein
MTYMVVGRKCGCCRWDHHSSHLQHICSFIPSSSTPATSPCCCCIQHSPLPGISNSNDPFTLFLLCFVLSSVSCVVWGSCKPLSLSRLFAAGEMNGRIYLVWSGIVHPRKAGCLTGRGWKTASHGTSDALWSGWVAIEIQKLAHNSPSSLSSLKLPGLD